MIETQRGRFENRSGIDFRGVANTQTRKRFTSFIPRFPLFYLGQKCIHSQKGH